MNSSFKYLKIRLEIVVILQQLTESDHVSAYGLKIRSTITVLTGIQYKYISYSVKSYHTVLAIGWLASIWLPFELLLLEHLIIFKSIIMYSFLRVYFTQKDTQYPYNLADNFAFQIFIIILFSTQKYTIKVFFTILGSENKRASEGFASMDPHQGFALDPLGSLQCPPEARLYMVMTFGHCIFFLTKII